MYYLNVCLFICIIITNKTLFMLIKMYVQDIKRKMNVRYNLYI